MASSRYPFAPLDMGGVRLGCFQRTPDFVGSVRQRLPMMDRVRTPDAHLGADSPEASLRLGRPVCVTNCVPTGLSTRSHRYAESRWAAGVPCIPQDDRELAPGRGERGIDRDGFTQQLDGLGTVGLDVGGTAARHELAQRIERGCGDLLHRWRALNGLERLTDLRPDALRPGCLTPR